MVTGRTRFPPVESYTRKLAASPKRAGTRLIPREEIDILERLAGWHTALEDRL
jgi:hypothetical protein